MVAIKDFKMPTNCEDCPLFWGENSNCALGCFIPYDYDRYTEAYKNEKCPLIEIKENNKADLKAILVELQLEILELKSYESSDGQDLVMLADIGILFQQKINELMAESEDT